MVERLAEPEDLEHRERDRIVLVPEDLLRADRVDALRHRQQREHEMVAGEAGLDPADVQRRLALPARRARSARPRSRRIQRDTTVPGTEVVTTLMPAASIRQKSSIDSVGRDSPDAE